MRFWRLHIAVLGYLLIFQASHLVAQGLSVNNSFLTSDLRPLVKLSDYWRDGAGQSFNIPFDQKSEEGMALKNVFYMDSLSRLPDTIYLYMAGLAWSAELYLNDKLLVLSEDPFKEHLLPLSKGLFNFGRNELRVNLSEAGPYPDLYPERVVGILHEVMLMEWDTLHRRPEFPERVAGEKSTLIYAPWTTNDHFQPNPASFWQDLKEIKSAGVNSIYFPFPPHGKYLIMLKKADMKLVTGLDQASKVAFFNEYPVLKIPRGLSKVFWKDKFGNKTEYYGEFQDPKDPASLFIQEPSRPSLILLLVIPLLGVLFLKLFAWKIYNSLTEYLVKSKIYIDLIGKSKYLKAHESALMNLFRFLLISVMIALPLYYIQCTRNYEWLNVLSRRSLLYDLFAFDNLSLMQYFGLAFLFVGGINLIKYTVTYFFSLIFRVQGIFFRSSKPRCVSVLSPQYRIADPDLIHVFH